MRVRDVIVVVGVATLCAVLLFAPGFFGGRLLALGDGRIEALPAFFAPLRLWEPDFELGYPIYADANQALFYPLRLLKFVPNGFNIYAILPFIIAASGLFGYLTTILRDRVAAFGGAVSFALGGFMISHFGHPMIDHPTAWTIVAFWTMAKYSCTRQNGWLAATALALALSLSSGQPQVVLFAVVLLCAHALFLEVPIAFSRGSLGGIFACFAAVLLGVTLGAVFLMPAAVLGAESTRAMLSYPEFSVDRIPFAEIPIRLAFPYVIGGGAPVVSSGPLFGANAGSATETTLFVSAAAIALAIQGAVRRPSAVTVFWIAVLIGGTFLSVGSDVPALSEWTYTIPPFNAFRIPGRHAYEITLSLSILAACGIAAFRFNERRVTLYGGILLVLCVVALALRDIILLNPAPFALPAIAWFAASTLLQLILLLIACGLSRANAKIAACLAVTIGAAVFAELGYWQGAPSATIVQTPDFVRALRKLPLGVGQRIYTYSTENTSPLRPNMPSLWGVSEVGGYTPLQYPQVTRFLHLAANGEVLAINSASMNYAAIRYVVFPSVIPAVRPDSSPFENADLGMFISSSDNGEPSVRLGLPSNVMADGLVIVSALGASVETRQNTVVASVIVNFADGSSQSLILRAGVDTAEIAYDRPDVFKKMRHKQAPIFVRARSSTWYVATRSFHKLVRVASLTLKLGPDIQALNVRKLSLLDSVHHAAYPFNQDSILFADRTHYRHIEDVDGSAIFENLAAYPRAWVESRAGARSETSDGRTLATFTSFAPERRILDVRCPVACNLVTADENNHEWNAFVDRNPVEIKTAHEALQSIRVPAGHHTVILTYFPRALIHGATISALAASSLLIWMLSTYAQRGRCRRRRLSA